MVKYLYNKYSVVEKSEPILINNSNQWGTMWYSSGYKVDNAGIFSLVEPLLMATIASNPPPIGSYHVQNGTTNNLLQITSKPEYNRTIGDPYYWKFFANQYSSSRVRSKGILITANVVAENMVYPVDGEHSDGFWYVRGTLANAAPTIALNTTDNRTLYENDTYTIGGTATDTDNGNVVNTYYQINSGAIRAITTAISSGAAIPFNKVLTFKNGAFYEGVTLLPEVLAVGSQHVLKVWAEDNQGGKSAEIIRTFYVVPNRPASLVISPFTTANDLINTDKITISGTVTDLDGNSLIVKYKIANGSYIQVYSGNGGVVSFQIPLSALSVGANTVTIQAVDSYGSITSKTLNITKTEKDNPLLTAVVRYKLTPPNSTAKGVLLWIQRESGDLVVGAEISMGAVENFVPMSKISTAFVSTGIEEDEFKFENTVAVENIILKLTMTRANASSDKGIKLISGVLS